MVFTAAEIWPALDRFKIGLETTNHDVVGAVVVVAVAGSFVEEALAQGLLTLEIVVDGRNEVRHREGLIVVHVVLEDGEAVRQAADADTLDVAGVVPRTAGVVVAALRDAIVGEDAQKRCLRPVREHPLEDEVAAVFDVDEVTDLGAPGFEDFVERRDPQRITGLGTELRTRARIDPIMKRQLEHLREVEVSRQDEGFLAEGARLDTA